VSQLKTVHRWTDREDALVREHYGGENRCAETADALAVLLDRPFNGIRGRVVKLGLTKKRPRWTQADLDFLNDNYGVMSDADLGRRLGGRSVNALKIISFRRLNGVNRKTNLYTARTIARTVGVDDKAVVAWLKRGYIRGKKSGIGAGKSLVWNFQYDDIVRCLRRRPWLVNRKKAEESYFRTIAQEQWDSNPWYSCGEAAYYLGLVDHNVVKRFIRRGWLKAERRAGAGGLGELIIREKELRRFLDNDPRPEEYGRNRTRARVSYWKRWQRKRDRWARRMATAKMPGRGVRVNRCPIGREVCHLTCHFRNERKCYFGSLVGRELSIAKRKPKKGRSRAEKGGAACHV